MNQIQSTTPFKTYADAYIQRGWFIFPLRQNGKTPLTPNGFKDASNDPAVIKEWARKYPYANIGIATEASHLIVVDCDSSKGQTPPAPWNQSGIIDGVDVFHTKIADSGNRFDYNTFIVWTPNSGVHYYFHDGGVPIPSGTNVNDLWRVDIRSKGGYIVAPGSVLENGSYEVESVGSVAQMPLWMRALVSPKKSVKFTSVTKTVIRYSKSTYSVENAIKEQIRILSMATIGTRNETLNRVSFNCGKLVGSAPELRVFAINELKRTALSIGLSETEAARTIASAFKAGLEASRG